MNRFSNYSAKLDVALASEYTPTWSNLTVGNATQEWYFIQINKFIFVHGVLVFGSTTSISGVPHPTVPLRLGRRSTYTSRFPPIGFAELRDEGGVGTIEGIVERNGDSETTVRIRGLTTSSSRVVPENPSSTVPFTWATSDRIHAQFFYETE